MFKLLTNIKYMLNEDIYKAIENNNTIDGPKRCAHFLAQIDHESGHFKYVLENLNYSEEGLLKTFKRYFTAIEAKAYRRCDVKIANKVYANRMGNGPESSGEGWKYRGSSYLQLTGKDNYTAFGKYVNDPEVVKQGAEYVAQNYATEAAIWFFDTNNLWTLCDQGIDKDTITRISKRVNGGVNGLSSRIELTNYYYKALTK